MVTSEFGVTTESKPGELKRDLESAEFFDQKIRPFLQQHYYNCRTHWSLNRMLQTTLLRVAIIGFEK